MSYGSPGKVAKVHSNAAKYSSPKRSSNAEIKHSNQSKNACQHNSITKQTQQEREFFVIFIQILLKYTKDNPQLKTKISMTVKECTKQNRETNKPLLPLLQFKLRKIINPIMWRKVENISIEYYCAKIMK